MSVVVRRRLIERGCSEDDVLADYPTHGLVSLPVRGVRELGLGVLFVPTDGTGCVDAAHAEVDGKKTESIRNKLSRLGTVVRWPPGFAPTPHELST